MNFEGIFTAFFLSAVLGFYFLLSRIRRRRYRKFSERFHGEHRPGGFFDPGSISANIEDRPFKIETDKTCAMPFGSTYGTTVSVSCRYEGRRVMIRCGFFRNFPDWKHVELREPEKTGFKVLLKPSGRKPVETEEDKSWILSLFQADALNPLEILKLLQMPLAGSGLFFLKLNEVEIWMPGILDRADRYEKILGLLHRVAGRIETV